MLFKIKMGTRKDVFEICRQFGHARPKSFASQVLGVNNRNMVKRILKEMCVYSMCGGWINLFNRIVHFRAFTNTVMKEKSFFPNQNAR
jgi:hypothetical protein